MSVLPKIIGSNLIRSRVLLSILFAVVALVFTFGEPASLTAQNQGHGGLFGTIIELSGDHPRAVAGEIDITLETTTGRQELTATPTTLVRIPGLEFASVDSLRPGDSVAVLTSGGTAESILVLTTLPVRTRHLTGVVVSVAEDDVVTVRSPEGDQITALALENLEGLRTGELVTAVVEQDLASGSLLITGLDKAIDSLARITSALELAETAGDTNTLETLRQRLLGNSTRHLSAMLGAFHTADSSFRGRVEQELDLVKRSYSDALSRYDAGKPKAEVTGITLAIDPTKQLVTVKANGFPSVEVEITSETGFWRAPPGLPPSAAENWLRSDTDTQLYVSHYGGRKTRLEQLDIASRVRVWYELDTHSATRVLVMPGESLHTRSQDALVALAQRGEAAGLVTAIDPDAVPPVVSIDDLVSGTVLTLTVSPDSNLRHGDAPVGITSLSGALVTAEFDPSSFVIIGLNTLSLDESEAMVFGVVYSVISKVVPNNLVMLNADVGLWNFSHTNDTIVRRDGRPATISQVRLGDLVRPETTYRTSNGERRTIPGSGQELVLLSVKSPKSAPVRGTIRGISATPAGGVLITLSDNLLEFVSLLVTGDTKITGLDKTGDLNNLRVGERVLTGTYDPISTSAAHLVLAQTRSLSIKGEITSVDYSQAAITITPRLGEPVRLLISHSDLSRIELPGITDPQVGNLKSGQQVRAGFYDPTSMEVLRLLVD